ncbi:MAG: dTMP kinase [Planctomycetota bacterium]
MFFSFDGVDGAGKSTQIARFAAWLEARGHDVTVCRDPGSTPLGESLRELLLHASDETPIGLPAEMLMYMAARAQLVEQVIRPALDAGHVVVSDRYVLANVVYQGHAGGLDPAAVGSVGDVATRGTVPACVFVLDLDPEEAARRRAEPADRMESRGMEYATRVRKGFLAEAKRHPEQITVIDAAGTPDEIEQRVREAALARAPQLAAP